MCACGVGGGGGRVGVEGCESGSYEARIIPEMGTL